MKTYIFDVLGYDIVVCDSFEGDVNLIEGSFKISKNWGPIFIVRPLSLPKLTVDKRRKIIKIAKKKLAKLSRKPTFSYVDNRDLLSYQHLGESTTKGRNTTASVFVRWSTFSPS